jgi:pyruvate/2-oxoglutarate dehydrogenase complex dihydrolipoamide dehydrogenase (E3) component
MKEHELIEGYAEFISPNVISIGDQTIHAHATIIATGARSCVPSQWQDRFGDGFRVRAGDREVLVEKLFVSTGRRPNLDRMNIKRLGASLDERGVPHHDPETLQVGRLPIYLAGDATGGIANLQRAADQGRIAGYKAARGFAERFNQKTPMAIVFSEPNIACVGTEWSNLDESRTAVAQIRFGPVGRALIMGQNRGILRVYANEQSGRLLGAAMIGPRCEHLAHLIAWAVESRMTAQQALQMPFLSSGHRRGPTGRAARPVAQNRAPQEAVFPIGLWISAAPGTHKCKGRLNGAERRQGRAE